jgi:hypothetical protein
MLAKPKDLEQMSFFSTFEEQLNHQHPLYILSNEIKWQRFDDDDAVAPLQKRIKKLTQYF